MCLRLGALQEANINAQNKSSPLGSLQLHTSAQMLWEFRQEPTATPGQHANEADAAHESRGPGPNQIKALTQPSVKMPPWLSTHNGHGVRASQQRRYVTSGAYAYVFMGQFKKDAKWHWFFSVVNIQQGDFDQTCFEGQKNYSRTNMCVGSGKRHRQLTWLLVTVCRHFRRFISISCKMRGDPPEAMEPYTDKWMGTMLAN